MKKRSKMKKLLLLATLLFSAAYSIANDSSRTFTLNSFLQTVKQFHPVVKLAGIQVDKAAANLIAAKGGFDPVVNAGGGNKTFDGISYYQNNQAQISIPTWYGIELYTGIEYLNGQRTDPTETNGKTSFAGISVPLAKNLLMDKRRAALQQAKILVQLSEQEQKILLNDIMMDAVDAYWKWVQAYWVYNLYNGIIKTNNKRTALVRTAYKLGERPAIDTTEAITQVQNFEYQQNEALLNWQNAGALLNTFLWKPNNEWYELPAAVAPAEKIEDLYDGVVFPELEQLIATAVTTHPELKAYELKLSALTVEKKLKFQELLPKADIKYNQLGKGYDIAAAATKTLFDNNYKLGIQFTMPLRLNQGRGEYKAAKLKITETTLQQNQKEVVVINKIKACYNKLVNCKSQVGLLQKTYYNYLQLQQGEETRFFNGESSLFLVNSRESKTLETLIKLTEATIKYHTASWNLQWAAGQLWKQ
jgi:outer membrane protein TolC